MKNTEFNLNWLTDPNVFGVNKMPPHTDFEVVNSGWNTKTSLNGAWYFNYSKNADVTNFDFKNSDFDCTAWDSINVPSQIQLEGYGVPQYSNRAYPWDGVEECKYPNVPKIFNPVAQYAKYIEIDQVMPRTFICFDGVETAFALWVNGSFIGYSEGSYTPANFEISEYINTGKNKIAVAVFKFSTGSWLEDQDFWRMSGIMRDVYLYTTPESRVKDFYFETDVDTENKSAKVKLSVEVENSNDCDSVFCLLEDSDTNAVYEQSMSAKNSITLDFAVENLTLWSAENPCLYTLKLSYKNSAETLQTICHKVGFKRSEIVDGIWYVNGKRLVIRGVNRHDFSSVNGRSVTKEEMLWDVVQMKRHNINAVRTSHYPNQTYFYQLCNEYGLYVMDETNLETHGTWQYGKDSTIEVANALPGSHPKWRGAVVDRAISMFERDKNHPAIISWSLGNESYGGQNFIEMKNAIRERDSLTPVHYEGIDHCKEFAHATDVTSQMYTKVAQLEEQLSQPCEKPVILCEYTHTMGNSGGGLYKYQELTEKYPHYQGGFIWDFIDQCIDTVDSYGNKYFGCGGDFGDLPNDGNFCGNGIVFADRSLSPKMQNVKNCYRPVNITPTANSVTIENKFLFTNLNEFDGKISVYKNGNLIDEMQAEFDVPPLKTKTFELTLPQMKDDFEYSVVVSLHLAEDTKYEQKGYEFAFGQVMIGKYADPKSTVGNFRVENSELNLGVYGDNFSAMFSRKPGGLISYKVAGKEMINTMPKPNFWRAPTDNDRGYDIGMHQGLWKIAGLYCMAKKVEEEITEDYVKVTYSYELATSSKDICVVKYTIFADGRLNVVQEFAGNKTLPHLPEFSVMFGLPLDMQNISYYGYGEQENYVDSIQGVKIGLYTTNVADNMAKYAMPQECGNRCGVRYMDITNNRGRGVRIYGDSELQISALPYNPHQIEAFVRPNQLPKSHETVLRVAEKRMGIGGDDSWGAPIHSEFTLPASEKYSLNFTIKPLG